ncbi:MAG: hypothetical protein HUU37_11295 [Bdellovibrionales bacterium]|nr:hypothetical protein [Bdellovibrionales bacterium]
MARRNSPHRIAADVRHLNARLRNWTRRNGVPFVDTYSILGTNPELFLDPVHPSAQGHRLMAEAIKKALEKDARKTYAPSQP